MAAGTLSGSFVMAAMSTVEHAADVLPSYVDIVDGMGLLPWGPLVLSEGLLDDPKKVAFFALGGLAVAAAGFQTAVYWRMQYVVS